MDEGAQPPPRTNAGMARRKALAMDKQNRITISITVEADLMADAHNAVDAMDLMLRERGGKVIKARFVRDGDDRAKRSR